MSSALALIALLLLNAGTALAAEPPVAAYSFDAGSGIVAEDLAGEHDGTIAGPTWAEGRYGNGLRFSGWEESNCVTVPNSPDLELTEDFTMEAWVRPEGSLWGDTILFKEFAEETGPTYFFAIGFNAKGKLQGEFVESEEPEVTQTVNSPTSLPEYKWSHVAFSFDGEKQRLYVNGELVATHSASLGAVPSTGPLQIGCAKGWESDYFWGKIDEVRIYDSVLSAEEIKVDRDSAIQTPPSTDPVAGYSLDAGEGEVAEDIFGSHDGTIAGPTWTEGKYGAALKFNGWEESNCVTVPDSPDLELSESFTVEAWVRPEGSLFGDTILFKEIEAESGPSYVFSIGFGAKGKLEGTIVEGEEAIQTVTSPSALAENQWAHVAFSFDGEKQRLYVNGSLVASHTASIGALPSSGPLQIGCAKGWESDYFWGKIDNLLVYHRPLSSGEIEADMKNDFAPPKIELSGALTEGLKEGTSEYPLKVHATDGEAGRPGVGVKRITISVDGEVVDSAEQECAKGNCAMEREWTYVPALFEGETHEIFITAEDLRGNVGVTEFGITPPDGDVANCNANEEATSDPSSTEELSKGGINRIYEGNEQTYEEPVPPVGFDPLTASAAELVEYAFPPRPEDPDSLAEWEQTMEGYDHTVSSNLCIAPRSTGNSAEVISEEAGIARSSNWSGYLTVAPDAENTWVGITGTFNQPYYHPTTCKTTRSNNWVGLGGYGETFRLVQAGTVIGTDHKIKPFLNFVQPAYEHGDLRVPGINIHKNDNVRVTLFYEIANERLVVSFFDNTTGASTRWGVRGLPHQFYDGSTGDFIDERSANLATDKYFDLPNFQKNEWFNTKVYTKSGKWEKLEHANPKRMFMEPSEHIMAGPGYIKPDGKSFTNHFFRCSP